jgi:DNA-binding HxlR family transcriptional regulator
VKRYGQVCPLARALDVVGERWSLLIVRELVLGPQRYRDLLDGLPGIPTNLLATRLSHLRAAGVVSKRTLPPPGVATVYELTEAGRALRPALAELRAWGARYAAPPIGSDAVRPGWALLSASQRPTALPAGRVCELHVEGEVFQLGAAGPNLSVHGGPASAPDAVVTLTTETLYRLMSGHTPPGRQTVVVGDREIADHALATLRGALTEPPPVPAAPEPTGRTRPRKAAPTGTHRAK